MGAKATSNLDPGTEGEIEAALETRLAGRPGGPTGGWLWKAAGWWRMEPMKIWLAGTGPSPNSSAPGESSEARVWTRLPSPLS